MARHIKEEQSTKTIDKNADIEPVMFGLKESKTLDDENKNADNSSEAEQVGFNLVLISKTGYSHQLKSVNVSPRLSMKRKKLRKSNTLANRTKD